MQILIKHSVFKIEKNIILLNFLKCVEPYSKCPFSNNQCQQRIQILGYYISVDAVIRDKI